MTQLIQKTAIIAVAATMMSALPAVAAEAPAADFVVKAASDTNIKFGVKAFKAGDFEKSIRYSQKAIDSGISPKRKAVAQSNLCAALAANNQAEEAREACDAALVARPDLEVAKTNLELLTIKLAAK